MFQHARQFLFHQRLGDYNLRTRLWTPTEQINEQHICQQWPGARKTMTRSSTNILLSSFHLFRLPNNFLSFLSSLHLDKRPRSSCPSLARSHLHVGGFERNGLHDALDNGLQPPRANVLELGVGHEGRARHFVDGVVFHFQVHAFRGY